jgi:hypothetical protein
MTIEAVRRELASGALLRRYTGDDGTWSAAAGGGFLARLLLCASGLPRSRSADLGPAAARPKRGSWDGHLVRRSRGTTSASMAEETGSRLPGRFLGTTLSAGGSFHLGT